MATEVRRGRFKGRQVEGARCTGKHRQVDVFGAGKAADVDGVDSGAVALYFGPFEGVYLAPHGVIAGEAASDEAGIAIDVLEDMDGVGGPELLVGADKHDSISGASYIILSDNLFTP